MDVFDGLISSLDMAEGISELEEMSITMSPTEMQWRKRMKEMEQKLQGLWGNYSMCNMHMTGRAEEEEKEREKSTGNIWSS